MPHSVHVEKVAQDVILNERPSTDCEARRNVDARHCRNTSLVIHMGLPKTGTTFLQNHVFSPFDQEPTLEMVPILEFANVMYSSHTGPELLKSQLYHCDSNEVERIKIFVLCEAVTSDTGPLTFIPAHQSQLVRDRTGYKYNGRLTDQQVSESLGGLDAEVALVGPPGTTAFIDTSRCLHYGSRLVNENAHRLVVMLQYVTPLGFLYPDDHREAARFRHLASPNTDEMTALVLGAM